MYVWVVNEMIVINEMLAELRLNSYNQSMILHYCPMSIISIIICANVNGTGIEGGRDSNHQYVSI